MVRLLAPAWYIVLLLLLSAGPTAGQKVDPELVGEHYRLSHPRLPHPDRAYLKRLAADPEALRKLRRTGNHADYVHLFQAYLATRDPELLAKITHLVDDPFKGWWFHKIDVLAVIYDWFYDDLDEATRRRLLNRIVTETGKACDYYREIRVSPYNDVGYHRLKSSIFLGALASYPDHPDAEPLIRFARHVLFDIYLPVWQQIIGGGGGWHEGITYMRIGLGKVLAPTLLSWGSATGRDLFRENAWLEDLIYYPIYTLRPDSTSLRSGDDNTPALRGFDGMEELVRIYDNPYGRQWLTGGRGFKDNLGPGAWPWWPPDRPDPAMRPVDELPPHHFFQGIGLLTMRSDWSEDAVFASFRVGDNFWSHQHFDSGHFNIYRRGALAIDSGTYAAGYNSEHHLKYQMQTIAHNCITVTDPSDTYPVASFLAHHRPLRKALSRVGPLSKWVAVADVPNDGGQRRVGSGGYNISPDSLADWQAARDDYEMGDMLTARLEDDFVYALGDVTAAYTNSRSGGLCPDYRARARRVRRWFRDFLYIRPEVFVVFDRVSAFDRSFQKRWLLHTINEPRIDGRTVTILRNDRVRGSHNWDWGLRYAGGDRRKLYQYDGKLVVTTLLPEDARLATVGGRGHEFDIGGHNYSHDKNDQEVVPDPLRGPDEPGSWRVEVSPDKEREDDLFLHVLVPLEADQPNPYRVTSVKVAGDLVGARIASPTEVVYALFNRRLDGRPVDGAIRYDVAPGTQATRHLLFGLSPGRFYRLERRADAVSLEPTDGATEQAVVVDGDGILRFPLPAIMSHPTTVETGGKTTGHW